MPPRRKVHRPRHSTRVILVLVLLAATSLLSGCLTKSTTVSDQFAGTVIVAAPPTQTDDAPNFNVPQSMRSNITRTTYPAPGRSPEPAPDDDSGDTPTPAGKVGSQLTFNDLSAGQFAQLGDVIAEAIGGNATVKLKADRSGDKVRVRGDASLLGFQADQLYVSITVTFAGEVIATSGEQTGTSTVKWVLAAGQNTVLSADAEYPDPATAAVPSWTWFMIAICIAVAAVVAWLAYQSRDNSPRPGAPQPSAAQPSGAQPGTPKSHGWLTDKLDWRKGKKGSRDKQDAAPAGATADDAPATGPDDD